MSEANSDLLKSAESSEIPFPISIKIERDSTVLSEKCPYVVNFANDKAVELLRTFGLEDSAIKKLKVRFINEEVISPDGRSTGAVYGNDTITISTGTWWKFLNTGFGYIENWLDTQGSGLSPDEILRARTKARSDLSADTQKTFDHDFTHECSHFAKDISLRQKTKQSLKRFKFLQAASYMTQRTSMFSSEGTPEEEARAENIVASIENSDNFKGLVVVSPR